MSEGIVKRRTIFPVIILLLLAAAWASAGDSLATIWDVKKDPSGLVKAYLSLDMKGARLEAISWETLKPYIAWKEEPSWEHVVVIENYEVVEDVTTWEILGLMEVLIPVKFQVLGVVYWETASFVPESKVEEFRVRVKVVGDRWRIIEPQLAPHVGQKRMINYVRQAMLQETDGLKLTKLAELRDELRKVGKEP
jgi:hypothetical protein